MKLLGVSISDGSREEILAQVRIFLTEPGFHRIATVNPEFLVLADRDQAFKDSLLTADLCVADGFGIVLAGWLLGKRVTRFPGADLLHEILAIAERDGHAIYLAIKKDGLSSYEEIRVALLKKYPRLSIESDRRHARVVICSYGAPEQEVFLESLRSNPGDIRLAMGAGGSFDYLTGKQKRAPKWLRDIGLEWLWRLILQPKRCKRIWNAVVIFPMKVLVQK